MVRGLPSNTTDEVAYRQFWLRWRVEILPISDRKYTIPNMKRKQAFSEEAQPVRLIVCDDLGLVKGEQEIYFN